MSFSFTAPTQPYSSTPIIISDGDGTHSMTMSGIQEPARLPEFTNAHRNMKATYTRPGLNHPGYRVIGSFGSSMNFKDLQIHLALLTTAQYTQLQGYYDARPGVFCCSIDGGANIYYVMFKDTGLVPRNYDFNQRCFTSATLDMYVVNKATTVTFS